MGSFNDVVICSINKHQVSEQQDPWANNLFNWTKALCYFLARHTGKHFSAEELSRSIGIYDAPLSAFVGGENSPDSMRGLVSSETNLQGWRCLDCGYSETDTRALESLLSDIFLPIHMFQACEAESLIQLIDDTLSFNLPGVGENREVLHQMVEESDISLIDRGNWMRPCPECNSEDTAVYRWVTDSDSGARFVPSKDNLPLKPKKA